MSHDSNEKAELQAKLNDARHNLELARIRIYLAEYAAEQKKALFIDKIEEAKLNTKGFSEAANSFVINRAESRLHRWTTFYDARFRGLNLDLEACSAIVEGYKGILNRLKEELEGQEQSM